MSAKRAMDSEVEVMTPIEGFLEQAADDRAVVRVRLESGWPVIGVAGIPRDGWVRVYSSEHSDRPVLVRLRSIVAAQRSQSEPAYPSA